MTTNEQLTQQIERAIRAGRAVTVADMTIRYCKGGQQFTDDDGNQFQALASGVFLRMNVFEVRNPDFSKPTRATWGFYVPLDDLDLVLQRPLDKLTVQEREALSAGLAFTAGLASIRAEEAQRRNRVTTVPVEEAGFETAPAI